jgi:hypothetical protein
MRNPGKFSSAIAALTLAFSRGCGAEVNTDDILMVALKRLTPGMSCQLSRGEKKLKIATEAQSTFIGEVYRALPVNCNFTVETEKLMTHPYIPRCLSLQAALGYKGRLKRRNLSSAVPWAIIQLRHAAVLIAYFFQHGNKGQSEAHDPGKEGPMPTNTRLSIANHSQRNPTNAFRQYKMGPRLHPLHLERGIRPCRRIRCSLHRPRSLYSEM